MDVACGQRRDCPRLEQRAKIVRGVGCYGWPQLPVRWRSKPQTRPMRKTEAIVVATGMAANCTHPGK